MDKTRAESSTEDIMMNFLNQTYEEDSVDLVSQASSYTVYKIGKCNDSLIFGFSERAYEMIS